MATISQRELRADSAGVLRRAEAGERITITVSGRPVAELGPIQPRRRVPADAARAALAGLPRAVGVLDDLRDAGGGAADPFHA